MKKFIISVAVVLLLAAAFVIKTLRDAGEFKTLQPHFSGTVQRIDGITGGEDITVDFIRRVAYISADDRFATLNGRKGTAGIYSLPLDSPDASPKLLRRIPDDDIHPHGFSYYNSPDGKSYLYVVNHSGGSHSIRLYQFSDDTTLSLLKIFDDEAFLISPNDVAAVDENRFYFTNDHGTHTSWGRMLEDYLQLRKSNVIYFNGKDYSIAASMIAHSNGININRGRNEVYVAASIGRHILTYQRNEQGELRFLQEIKLGTGADNIELDERENLWVACHPKLLTFVKHARDTSVVSPSQVIMLSRNADGKFSPREIYLNDGRQLSASSVAAVAGKIILVGAVFDNHLLRCEMKD